MKEVITVVSGLLGIAMLLAAVALVFYLTWWAVMLVVRFIPIVGTRHRHDRWDEFQRAGRPGPSSPDEHQRSVERQKPD